jgi:hypothetical protein
MHSQLILFYVAGNAVIKYRTWESDHDGRLAAFSGIAASFVVKGHNQPIFTSSRAGHDLQMALKILIKSYDRGEALFVPLEDAVTHNESCRALLGLVRDKITAFESERGRAVRSIDKV